MGKIYLSSQLTNRVRKKSAKNRELAVIIISIKQWSFKSVLKLFIFQMHVNN